MCNFFSCISKKSNGEIYYFTIEQVVKIMSEGNKENYNFNSHTSIANFYKVDEDKCDKWEYNPTTKELKLDQGEGLGKETVLKMLQEYFVGKNITYLQNIYNGNSGNWNSGYRNSGDENSGNGNSGNGNSGYRNSGDENSGNGNSGNGNSGYRNSGDGNSGYRNSGDGNSGYKNSGDGNSGITIASFCSHKKYFLFNKSVTEQEYEKLNFYINLPLTEWISEVDMSEEEKAKYPNHKVTGGYLKVREYKEAWKLVSQNIIDKIKKLPKYNKKVFKEITGLD